jgi:hypothetical protein
MQLIHLRVKKWKRTLTEFFLMFLRKLPYGYREVTRFCESKEYPSCEVEMGDGGRICN